MEAYPQIDSSSNATNTTTASEPQDMDVPPDVLDSITFGEEIKIDWRKYPLLHRKCWDMQKTEAEQ